MEITKVREQLKEKNAGKLKLEFKPTMEYIMSFLGCLLMMNPFVLGQLSPFSISLICALPENFSLCAGAGGIVGAFLFFNGTEAVKYVTIILFCTLVKSASLRIFDGEADHRLIFVNAFGGTFLVGTAIMLATGFKGAEFLSTVFEALLASGGAFIFKKTAETVWSSKEPARCSTEESVSVLLTAGIILMHFYRYKLFGISPVVIIFLLASLICSRVKNGYGGALCGLCAGFALGLSRDMGFACLGIALGGLACGELNRKNRIWGTAGCILPVCICSAADGTNAAFMIIADCIIACAVFLILPERFFTFLYQKFNTPSPVYIRTDDSRRLAVKLNGASEAITRVSDCVSTVQHNLKPSGGQLNSTVRKTWGNVCSKCELKESCHSEVKNPTDEAVERLASALRNGAELDETRFPKGFYASCYSFTEMQSALKSRYLDYVANQNAQGQIEQVHKLMSDQFRSMADILHGFACEFDEEININSEAADRCADEAREFGLEVIGTDSYLDRFGRLFISLKIQPPSENFNISAFTDSLSSAVGTPLDIPELEENEEFATLKFSQKQSFDICVGAFSRPAENETICGDYYRSFRDENGRYIIILSDGMGTGSRAAVDSAMAAELFSKLLRAELSFDCALAISNSAMLVKSSDESLATLDVVCVDLYTGKTEFMKAGAAATFVKHRSDVAQLEQASLPIGILNSISFSKAAASLEKGDIILMVSDGVLNENNNWIQQEMKLWQTDSSPQALAEFIVESACERRLSKHRDDMTAVAVYIE